MSTPAIFSAVALSRLSQRLPNPVSVPGLISPIFETAFFGTVVPGDEGGEGEARTDGRERAGRDATTDDAKGNCTRANRTSAVATPTLTSALGLPQA